MDDQSCPKCKTTKYRNPSLKLMVNVCGHALCETCVDRLFFRGSGSCPECDVPLRRNNFRIQLFEDNYVEKEVDIRKRILRDFNKKEEDFSTLRAFNDYLEEVETIVFNLSNEIDIEETKRKIEQYKAENKHIIKKNKNKLSKEEEELEAMIEMENYETEMHKKSALEENMNEKKAKKKNAEALLDQLTSSNLSADQILAAHQRKKEDLEKLQKEQQPKNFSTGIKVGKQTNLFDIPMGDIGTLYKYEPLILDFIGPYMPKGSELKSTGYLKNIRKETNQEKGGGFKSRMACERALQDAFCGLLFSTEDPSDHGAMGYS